MEKTVDELCAMGIAIESDEEWMAKHQATLNYHAERERQWEREAEEEARHREEERAKVEGLEGDALVAYVLDAADSTSPPTSEHREATATSVHSTDGNGGPERTEPDWVQKTLDETKVSSGGLPYYAYRARRSLHDTLIDARVLSKRRLTLTWDSESSGTLLGKTSKNSIDNLSINSLEELNTKEEERTIRTKIPECVHRVANAPEQSLHRIGFEGKLPRWKDLGNEAHQSQELRELLFGLRVTSLASAEQDVTVNSWLHESPAHDIGLLSIELDPAQANRFLCGEKGSAASGLRRGLLRSLQSHTEGLEAIALWTAHPDRSGAITLFLALVMVDFRNVWDACTLEVGRRYVRDLEHHGIEVRNGQPHLGQLSSFFGVTADQLAACDPSKLTDWMKYVDIPEYCDLDEFIPGKGFLSREEISERNQRVAERWQRTMHAYGLPAWFSHAFIESIRDYLLRAPEDATTLARAIARIKKRRGTAVDKAAFARLTSMDQPLTNMRFYRGSPAQFAAIAARSGEILGSYCDSRHKKGHAEALYERLRAADH